MNFNSSEEDVSWFNDRYREGTLELRPPYQRKPVWAARQKCYLIESILLGLPVPEVFVQKSATPLGETTYAVVDGQQRIRAVLQFIGSDTDPDQTEFSQFSLDKLDASSPWKGQSFSTLSPDVQTQFYGYSFAVRYLKNANEGDVKDMFRRLNRYPVPLKPQEYRNATYAGPFIKLAERLSENDYWAENKIVTPDSIRRMGDIEFISELVIGVLHGPQGGSQAAIDEYYLAYEDYDDQFPEQKRGVKLFDQALAAIQTILPSIKETRWSNKSDFYSLFLALAYLLRNHNLASSKLPQIRKALNDLQKEVEDRLADEDADVSEPAIDYVRAVEKGANDKARRAARHDVLIQTIKKYFTPKKRSK